MASLMLLAGTVVFVATALVEHRSLNELVERTATLRHAMVAQLMIRREGALLVDLETGQRGFIITGQTAFLEPYERARQELQSAQAELRKHLTSDGSEAPQSLARLELLASQRVEQVEKNVAQRWATGDAVLKDLQGYVAGKRLMDEIRGELAQLESVQSEKVAKVEVDIQRVRDRTTFLASALPAVGCALIAGATFALGHERRRRDQADKALQQANASLENQVLERTAALTSALARIRSFATELDESIEAERRRLAREVHDQIGQVGTATKMLVLGLRRKLSLEHEGALGELLALADEGISTARNISAALRPPLLDDFGLGSAVDHYAKGLARQGELQIRVEVKDSEELSPAQANQLFRVMQEATTNVLRHAQAQVLELRGRQVDDSYLFEIIDDGRGPGSVRVDASGLRNMRERAELAGGRFEFGPGPLRGTRVAVLFPLAGFAEHIEEAR